MMNEFQRRILAEAAKFGGKNITTAEKIVNKLSEAPAIAPGAVTGMFGYSKQQFEMKMRQLIQKMGFEKGINKMEVGDKKMVLHFANAAKARDFVITFNGLTKRQSKGSAASVSTSFDKAKAPAGTNAVVTVDFSMLKTEGLENPSHLFVVLESLHEQYIAEGGVKAAIEDFMYSFPKEMIADLKKVIKLDVVNTTEAIKRKNKIEVIRKKYKIPASVLGTPSWKMIVDYFDTFHGESVEEQGETVEEGVRMMAGVEKMLKDEGHPSMVSSLRKIKKSLEGKPTGSVLVVTKEKSPESVSIKVYEPSDFASLTKGLTKKPEAKVGSKGSWSGGEVTVVAIKEEVEVAEQFKAGDKVKVPHKGKMVSGKIVRFDSGGTDKARQHGGGYVVDVGEPASILVPKQKVQKEEVEITEASNNSIAEFTLGAETSRTQYHVKIVQDPSNKNRLVAKSEAGSFAFPKELFAEFCKSYKAGGSPSGQPKGKEHYGVPQPGDFPTFVIGDTWQKMFIGKVGVKNIDLQKTSPQTYSYPDWLKAISKNAMEEVEQIEEVYDGAKSRAAMQSNIKKAPTPKDKEELVKLDNAIKKSPKVYGISMDYLGDLAPGETPSRKKLTPMAARAADGYDAKNTDRSVNLGIISKINKRIKEEVEIEEAKVKYLTGPGKKDSKRIIGIYTMSGKWVKDMNSEREAAAFVNKSWGESVEEEEDMIGEDNWGGGFETSREAQAKVQAGLRADAKKRQMLIISALQKVIDGQMSKVAFKKLTGSSYADIMSLPFYSKKVKMKKEEVENFDEAYAPLDTPNIIGAFTEASKKKRFEYRKSTDKWGLIHGLPHEVCVRESSPSEWRAAKVKGTVCYIATDEGEDGRPVLEKWAIRNHVKYVKAEETDQEGEVIEEQDRAAVQGSKMVYVGQRLRALQSKSMMSGSVVKGETYKVATNKDGKVDLVHQSIGYRTAVRNVDATTIEALIKNRVLS